MKNIIIISQEQFGYKNSSYYYCKYLKYDFEIVYVCWNYGLPKIEMDGVKVIYVNRKGNFLLRSIRFLQQALGQIGDERYIVFTMYFKGVSLALRILRPRNCFVLDIRTGSVNKNPIVRWLQDARLKFEARFFRHVTVISYSLAEKLCLAENSHILPLGADVISLVEKSFDNLCLLYVGTLYNRNIDVTIHGFKKFYDELKDKIPISYTIIGNGPNKEEESLRDLVIRLELTNVVTVTGTIQHTLLKPWFDSANAGVSYVPLTEYYDCQPVTKTFEYLLSGIPVIATNTSENRRIINQENGILVGDSSDEFYSGLKMISAEKKFYSTKIRNSNKCYSWKNIVNNNLIPYFRNILKEES